MWSVAGCLSVIRIMDGGQCQLDKVGQRAGRGWELLEIPGGCIAISVQLAQQLCIVNDDDGIAKFSSAPLRH